MRFRQVSTGAVLEPGNQDAAEIMLASDAYVVIPDDTDADTAGTSAGVPEASEDTDSYSSSEPDISEPYILKSESEQTDNAAADLAGEAGITEPENDTLSKPEDTPSGFESDARPEDTETEVTEPENDAPDDDRADADNAESGGETASGEESDTTEPYDNTPSAPEEEDTNPEVAEPEDVQPDAAGGDRRRYTEEELNGMTISGIRALAAELGYPLTGTLKAEIVAAFLAAQG